jgi:hypothetical protein
MTFKPIKEDIIKLIQELPDDATLEDIQYHLFVKQKLLRAEEQIKRGKIIPHNEVIKKAKKKWFKYNGQKKLKQT